MPNKVTQNMVEGLEGVQDHVDDSTIHVTPPEKATWGNKQDALPAENRRKITFGTAAPSGGADGDVYFQYD
ncbi:hypothetical protein [Exiguobacterium sp. s5]|uniref:hypothetical protein n=1 Tax=Exiguobacterium sp. s5 TaxID=2751239 RepID=UPI001BECAF7D|nr:hypothetical protein [Exiguobacterium sp. s5]